MSVGDAGTFAGFDLADDGGGELTSGTLVIAPATLDFGRVKSGMASTLLVSLANAGTSEIALAATTTSGAPFAVDASQLPHMLAPGAVVMLPVSFSPTMTGHFMGTLSISSSASATPAVVNLVGKSGYEVVLDWDAPVTPDGGDPAVGYNVYRGMMSGGPYTKINTSLVSATTYTDTTVVACMTYDYVTTSVDANNVESAYSNETMVSIPCD